MPKGSTRHPGRIAGFWLSKRSGSHMWCRTWFDAATRQTRRASLGIDDLQAATLELARWITQNVGTNRAVVGGGQNPRMFGVYIPISNTVTLRPQTHWLAPFPTHSQWSPLYVRSARRSAGTPAGEPRG